MTAEPFALFSVENLSRAAATPRPSTGPRRRRTTSAQQAARTGSASTVAATPTRPTTRDAPSAQAQNEVSAPERDSPEPAELASHPRPVPRLLLSPTEAAQALGISRSKLYELMRAGAVESVLIDTARRVPVDALDAYVTRLRKQRSN